MSDDYYNQSEVLARPGWTITRVHQLLGEPDDLRDNPQDPRWRPMKLYVGWRVVKAERSPEFVEAVRKLEARRERALLRLRKKDIAAANDNAQKDPAAGGHRGAG